MHRRLFGFCLLLFLTAFLFAAFAGVSAGTAGERPADNLAVVLLIDVSGSMSYTDPERLRETAALLFVDLLGEDDLLAVITFDHQAETVVPMQAVGGVLERNLVKEKLSRNLDPGGDTSFRAALDAACEQIRTGETEGRRPVVVLLTDGEPNPDTGRRHDTAFMQAYMESLWETVSGFTVAGWPVYTVGFSDEIDPAFIERISILTRGNHYLLHSPAELMGAFFELLGTLKNRDKLFEESLSLDEVSRVISFVIDEQVTQFNLVAESSPGRDFTLELLPPTGGDGQIEGMVTTGGPGYTLVVLQNLQKALRGEWRVAVSGSGPLEIRVNADKMIKVWFVEPAGNALHPLGELLNFRVRLTGVERRDMQSLTVMLHLYKPDRAGSEVIPLDPVGEIFSGNYDAVDRTGIYELAAHVLMDGETVAAAVTSVEVKRLPRLSAEFWPADRYRLSEEMEPAASLQLGGHRLVEGDEFEVDHINYLLTYEDGLKEAIPLYDSGDPAHADLAAGDGIWSNRFELTVEGTAEAVLVVAGRFRGDEFLLEKSVGRITVAPPGKIMVLPDPGELISAPGRRLTVSLRVENRSAFDENLAVCPGYSGRLFSFTPGEINLEPGATKVIPLEIAIAPETGVGEHDISLSFKATHPLTVVEPSRVKLPVEILAGGRYMQIKALQAAVSLVRLGWPFASAVLLFYGGGLLLFRVRLTRPVKRKKIIFWKTGRQKTNRGRSSLDLKPGKRQTVISFNPASEKAHHIIAGSREGGEFSHDLIFRTEASERLPACLLGWQTLFGRRKPYLKVVVECSRPGIIETGDGIYTRKELFHGDEFKSGEYHFKYENPSAGQQAGMPSGANILEGKI